MKPWLEDLSEEWIPQTGPAAATTPSLDDSPPPQTSQSAPAKPQSRLPRLRHSSGSFSEISIHQLSKSPRPPRPKTALSERSLNDNNIAPGNASNTARSRATSASFSGLSQGSVIYNGTVAQKAPVASPTKDHNTPEWKRRLLKGDVGYGEQKDLFSPMGLENIFQKPNGASPDEPKPRKTKLGLSNALSAMPSSPPPWPTDSQPQSRGVSHSEQPDPSENTQLEPEAEDGADSTAYFSSLHPSEIGLTQDAPRTVSGQLEFENENFSPVYLSMNGGRPRVRSSAPSAPTAPEFSASSLAHRLRHLGTPPPPTFVHQPPSEENSVLHNHSRNDSSFSKLQDDTLPEDLPAGTPDVGDVLTPFVERNRGGYGHEEAFRRRPLSPSPAVGRNNSNGSNASKGNIVDGQDNEHLSAVDGHHKPLSPSPQSPVTPRRPKESQFLSPQRTSGSPLKLFGAHDTFTSNRLQRRLSQLEYKSEKIVSNNHTTETTKTVQKTTRMTSVEEVSINQPTDDPRSSPPPPKHISPRRISTFGQGQLDDYAFPEDNSVFYSDESYTQEHTSAPDDSPSMDIAPPGSRQPIKFDFNATSPTASHGSSRVRRQGLTRVSQPFRRVTHSKSYNVPAESSATLRPEPSPEQEYAEGKRGPTSPFKNPIPKRRRTLHSTESDTDDNPSDDEPGPVQEPHAAVESDMGKRKDARYDAAKVHAEPDVLAQRHILRPRNPTPNQRMRDEKQAEIIEATEAFLHTSPRLNTIREQIDTPSSPGAPSEEEQAAIVAREIAAFTMKRAEARDRSRKRSVTTQDFLDEAVKIMDYIRAKGRPTSGLGSLEESEFESEIPDDDHLQVPPAPLSFSRPPSREGRSSEWREPNKPNLDPKAMSHLRKYQDRESEDFMGSSVNSLKFAQRKDHGFQDGNSVIVEQDNIRITDNLNRLNRDSEDDENDFNTRPLTSGTNKSVASSMGHTIATNISRRSEHVATLAPEAVAHLIPEQIGGMSFDRAKNMWVRNKSPSKEHRPSEVPTSHSETEEDPFNNIPDLSVDSAAENMMKNQASPTRPQATAETFTEDTDHGVEGPGHASRPVTREGRAAHAATDTSSVPSKFSNNFGWSFPKTETRATSWSDQEAENVCSQRVQQPPTTYTIPESDEVDVEHEIKYFEGRGAASPPMGNAKIRDITFSIEQPGDPSSPQRNGPPRWAYANTRQPSHTQKTPWRPVPGARTLPARKQTIEDDGELSIMDDLPSRNYRMQLSMSVSAPVLGGHNRDALMALPSSPAKADVTFMLSDLPDFTLHQVDECELPDRVVVKHNGKHFSKALEDRYAQGTAEMIKALQDVVPDEPFWEDLRKVDLHGKGLVNLHRLEEFCYRLEELDVSNNNICQVKGIPYTMRRLRAQNNCLTGLTSWMTLMNLQHLDVSCNEIDSLDGLSDLIHLRTLKVDNNQIKSLDGILMLDGLMELSAGGNQIENVDFANADLKSLTSLNLAGNRLTEVRNLHRLPQLRTLDLDDNCIDYFPTSDMSTTKCHSLRSLRLCRNDMSSLDMGSYFPKLESLYVDGNRLAHIPGLERLGHLRTFSAREQSLPAGSSGERCVANLAKNPEVRNLYLSVNPSRGFEISQHLLNLQRLELASMGLEELPDNFGQLTPNIRAINLNFNSLKDLRPLLNIKRLNELLVAGNKLTRLRTNLAVLGKLTTLSVLDLRENPLTLRFYPPTSENRVMSLRQSKSPDEDNANRFVLPSGDPESDKQYLLRLDFETRLRRRVQEIMLSTQCRNLRELDGLPFDKARILVKDDIWDRLSFLGVIRRAETSEQQLTINDE